jgi:hypothetical protein
MDARQDNGEFLQPSRVKLTTDGSGRVRLTLDGDCSYLEVTAVRAFPFSDTERHIGLLDANGGSKMIGLITNPTKLDASSRQVLLDALADHYFMPTITRICAMKEQYGAAYFDVETDRGNRHFVSKGLRDGTRDLGNGELLIPDVDGNRYRIANWRRLDAQSKKFLMPIL